MLRLLAKFFIPALLAVSAPCALSAECQLGSFHEVASTDPKLRPTGAHLTLGAALHIAEVEARSNKIDPQDFQPWFWYHCEKGEDCSWEFFYITGCVDHHFEVVVNDRTQHADFSPRFVRGK